MCFLPQVPVLKPMELMVEASPRRIFANAHTYHINSISVNSDGETYLSADDLRINLWHMEITDQSFNIVDIKPANMEELTEVRRRCQKVWEEETDERLINSANLRF